MDTKTPGWKTAFLVVLIGASVLVIILSVPKINFADVIDAFKKVGLPMIGILTLTGWGAYFGRWAVKTFGAAWGLVLTLLPIFAAAAFAFALAPR